MTRPRDLWFWAWEEGRAADPTAPSRLHDFERTKHHASRSGIKRVQRDRLTDIRLKAELRRMWLGRRLGQQPPVGFRQEHGPSILGSPPFSREFVEYLDRVRPMTPIRRALFDMKSGDKVQSIQYQVLFAIVEGGYENEIQVAVVLRCNEKLVRAAARDGLPLLWDLTERVIADERRVTLTPAAGKVR